MQISKINVSVIPGKKLQIGDFFLLELTGPRRLGFVVRRPDGEREVLAFCNERSESGSAIQKIGVDVIYQSSVLKIGDPVELYVNNDPMNTWEEPGILQSNLDAVGIYPDGRLEILFVIGGRGFPDSFVKIDISKDAIHLVPDGHFPEAPVAISRQWHLQTAVPGKEQVIYCPPPRVRVEE